MTFFATQYGLPFAGGDDCINVDLFAGGGGASTGIEMGLNRPVHIAINHNPAAISMHEANHPGCLHLQTDVWEVDPVLVLAGRSVGWFHASPDCTHHSQAAGGQPRKKEIRDLSWVVSKWAGVVRPKVISMENVQQIRNWGPLVAKRCKQTGRVVRLDGSVAAKGERTPREQQFLVPDKKRRGKTWKQFIHTLQALGYVVEHRLLRACDYGAPTSRERLFLVARRDGEPIVWPAPTHAAKPTKGQKPHRTAAECIDWSVPGRSIFGRKKPLAEATLRRIAKGIQREVIERKKPFIVPLEAALVTGTLVQVGYGEREGQSPRVPGLAKPLGTIVGSGKHAFVTAFMAQANGGFNATHSKPLDEPVTTITSTGSQQQLITASLVHMRGNCDTRPIDSPLHTISAGGQHHGLLTASLEPLASEGALRCAAFMVNYYGNGDARSLQQPLDTITTKDRLALVTVWIDNQAWVIVDIHMRMLQPHELYKAQGFPDNYIIDRGHDGRQFTKAERVHMCGNSVSPPPMAAIARANNPYADQRQQAAA